MRLVASVIFTAIYSSAVLTTSVVLVRNSNGVERFPQCGLHPVLLCVCGRKGSGIGAARHGPRSGRARWRQGSHNPSGFWGDRRSFTDCTRQAEVIKDTDEGETEVMSDDERFESYLLRAGARGYEPRAADRIGRAIALMSGVILMQSA